MKLDNWNMPNLLAKDCKMKQLLAINPSLCKLLESFFVFERRMMDS